MPLPLDVGRRYISSMRGLIEGLEASPDPSSARGELPIRRGREHGPLRTQRECFSGGRWEMWALDLDSRFNKSAIALNEL